MERCRGGFVKAGQDKQVIIVERRSIMFIDPFNNPDAPAGPMLMPQYRNGELEQAARLNTQASGVFAQGSDARSTGDKYVRATVLLATVLFLLAVSQRFRHFRVRVGLLCVAVVILAYAIGTIATYPRF